MCNFTEAMKKTYLMMKYETWNWKKNHLWSWCDFKAWSIHYKYNYMPENSCVLV